MLLVTGGTGQIGYELVRELAPLGTVVAPGRGELDLARPESMRAVVRHLRPQVIINAAAYTAVDRAESEQTLAAAINAVGPGVLAEEARRVGAAFVHYSTDYVFDGRKGTPYVETDEPAPLNVYGATKLAGEEAVKAAGGAFVILRTSWVYGTRGTNFLRTMLRLARERSELKVVDDQVGVPTWSRSIAAATAAVVRRGLDGGSGSASPLEDVTGLYHLAAGGRTTWYRFARAILDGDPRSSEHICARVVPISTAEYPTLASRPAYSVLDSSRAAAVLGVRLPDWREQLTVTLREISGAV